jgi:hypothetical protein
MAERGFVPERRRRGCLRGLVVGRSVRRRRAAHRGSTRKAGTGLRRGPLERDGRRDNRGVRERGRFGRGRSLRGGDLPARAGPGSDRDRRPDTRDRPGLGGRRRRGRVSERGLPGGAGVRPPRPGRFRRSVRGHPGRALDGASGRPGRGGPADGVRRVRHGSGAGRASADRQRHPGDTPGHHRGGGRSECRGGRPDDRAGARAWGGGMGTPVVRAGGGVVLGDHRNRGPRQRLGDAADLGGERPVRAGGPRLGP